MRFSTPVKSVLVVNFTIQIKLEKMKISATILITGLLFSCILKPRTRHIGQKQVPWAVRFAKASMTLFDNLIYYNNDAPEYEYDLTFPGSAIDKLSSVDPKYSEYAKSYIDNFVTEKQVNNDQKGVAQLILAAIELNK